MNVSAMNRAGGPLSGVQRITSAEASHLFPLAETYSSGGGFAPKVGWAKNTSAKVMAIIETARKGFTACMGTPNARRAHLIASRHRFPPEPNKDIEKCSS